MKYIVIDLEMNPVSRKFCEERKQWRSEVIQIGAVALDENYREIGCFKVLVKPQYHDRIISRIEKLTGIRTDMVKDAPVFENAIHMFFDWCLLMGGDSVSIQQWSESDYRQISAELALKGVKLSESEQRIMEGWEDFQDEFGKKLGLTDQLSLKNAIMYAGVDAVGRYHDALYDARNTASLFRIVRDPVECDRALRLVIDALKPASHNATLGELINFSEFALTS